MEQKTKVLVVDDSAFMRRIASDAINSQIDMEVIEVARNGLEALEHLQSNSNIDVVILDVEMPKMNGVDTLKKLREGKNSIPIIMFSSLTTKQARVTMECLENGAFDVVVKPNISTPSDLNEKISEFVEKIRSAAEHSRNEKQNRRELTNTKILEKSYRQKTPKKQEKNTTEQQSIKEVQSVRKKPKNIKAIVVATSAGGPKTFKEIVKRLPADLGVPILVVQHMPEGFTKQFAERMNEISRLNVFEAENGMRVQKDSIYIAKGGYHLEVNKGATLYLNKDEKLHSVRPAADKLFITASDAYNGNILGVVLTGMGKDGAEGVRYIKRMGGYVLAQDAATSIADGMPRAARNTGCVDEVLPLESMSERIISIMKG